MQEMKKENKVNKVNAFTLGFFVALLISANAVFMLVLWVGGSPRTFWGFSYIFGALTVFAVFFTVIPRYKEFGK